MFMRARSRSRNHAHPIRELLIATCVGAVAIQSQPATATDTAAAIEKANLYIEAAKSTERAVESWERYASWVNMKTGPTGNERYISYGMYELYDVATLLKAAQTATTAEPRAEKLDEAMARYIAAYDALAPVMNEAAKYYDRQGYAADKLAKGKDYHQKMLLVAPTFLDERKQLLPLLRAHIREVQVKEVVALEEEEGKSASWCVANVMATSNGVMDVFPREPPQQLNADEMEQLMREIGPDTFGEKFDQLMSGVKPAENTTIDVTRFDAALESYAKAVAEFDAFNGEKPEGFDDFKPIPGEMLSLLQAFQEPLRKSGGREFEGGAQMVGQIVQYYYNMMNESQSVWSSRLRHLP